MSNRATNGILGGGMYRNAIETLDAWLDGVKSKISLFFGHVTCLTGPTTRDVDLGETRDASQTPKYTWQYRPMHFSDA